MPVKWGISLCPFPYPNQSTLKFPLSPSPSILTLESPRVAPNNNNLLDTYEQGIFYYLIAEGVNVRRDAREWINLNSFSISVRKFMHQKEGIENKALENSQKKWPLWFQFPQIAIEPNLLLGESQKGTRSRGWNLVQ